MKKNIFFTFMAMTAAVAMLACEEIPGTGTSADDGEEQEQPEEPGTDQEPEPGPETDALLVGTFNIRYYNTGDGTGKRQS